MSCWAWPVITSNSTAAAAAAMLSKLSGRFSKLVCGISPPPTADDDRYRAGLRSLYLLSPSPESQPPPRRSSSSSPSARRRTEDDDDETAAAASPAEPSTQDELEEAAMASTLPCLAFPSEHGYMLFSLAETRFLNGGGADAPPPAVPPVLGRRLIPSPYGGTALAADVCYRHPCHLVDPFTGDRAPLPDLPVPFSEKKPVDHHPADRVTDDGLAWDWSPRGVMVARGDTAFFLAHGGGANGGAGEWQPVHQAERGSPMTVNYRAGRFFLLELRSLVTTVLDAATLRRRAKIPAPACPRGGGGVEAAYLAPCDDGGAILLVRRAGDDGGGAQLFTETYRARGGGGGGGRSSPPRWARARDVGGRAVFVDGAHAFTVAAGGGAAGAGVALANHVYMVLTNGGAARPCGRVDVAYDVGCIVKVPDSSVLIKTDDTARRIENT